ncbi:MAG: hypothetical protein LBI27_03260 [Clostridiales bacterium]|nr:hypothetical protein [Clostridiales bacterium]
MKDWKDWTKNDNIPISELSEKNRIRLKEISEKLKAKYDEVSSRMSEIFYEGFIDKEMRI